MAKKHILVVEDEDDIRELVRFNLESNGYQVEAVATGEEALGSVHATPPDLVVLDLMLPGVDGLDVCRQIRADDRTSGIAIVMLTAKGEESDIIVGLELGADDYLTKPFSPKVLLARVRAVLRRRKVPQVGGDEITRIHGMVIHPGRHEVLVEEERVPLTATEFKILHLLARRPGWVFPRSSIVDAVHGDGHPVTDRSIDVQLVGLRKKLGTAGDLIETVRGVGYRFRE